MNGIRELDRIEDGTGKGQTQKNVKVPVTVPAAEHGDAQ